MQLENKILCHWDLVRLIDEEQLIDGVGDFLTLSVSHGESIELMIFLGKSDDDSEYEVRVYKNKPSDKYIPHESDNVLRYEEKDEYATFFFKEYENAREFVDNLAYVHREYHIRPIRKYNK